MYRRIILILCIAASISACSSKPSEGQGQAAFSAQLQETMRGAPFLIQDFKKTNGLMREIAGAKVYTLYYEATVFFPNGLRPECLKDYSKFTGFNNFFQANQCMMERSQGLQPQPVGGRARYSGTLDFQKTEAGWLPATGASLAVALGAPPPPATSTTTTATVTRIEPPDIESSGFWDGIVTTFRPPANFGPAEKSTVLNATFYPSQDEKFDLRNQKWSVSTDESLGSHDVYSSPEIGDLHVALKEISPGLCRGYLSLRDKTIIDKMFPCSKKPRFQADMSKRPGGRWATITIFYTSDGNLPSVPFYSEVYSIDCDLGKAKLLSSGHNIGVIAQTQSGRRAILVDDLDDLSVVDLSSGRQIQYLSDQSSAIRAKIAPLIQQAAAKTSFSSPDGSEIKITWPYNCTSNCSSLSLHVEKRGITMTS